MWDALEDAHKDLPASTLDELAKSPLSLFDDPIPNTSNGGAPFHSQPNCGRSTATMHEISMGTTVENDATIGSQLSQSSSFGFDNSLTAGHLDMLQHSNSLCDEDEDDGIPDLLYEDQVSERRSSMSGSMGVLKGMR